MISQKNDVTSARKHVALFAACFLLLLSSCTKNNSPTSNTADPDPGIGGTIIFTLSNSSTDTVQSGIYALDLTYDIATLKQLAGNYASEPLITPDRNFIIYSLLISGSSFDIWKMGTDGSDNIDLVPDSKSSTDSWSSLSPDGANIAFNSVKSISHNGQYSLVTTIDVISSAGGTSHSLTDTSTTVIPWAPFWSPDGKYIAYQVSLPTTPTSYTIRIVSPTDTSQHFDVPVSYSVHVKSGPWWSPDGKHLVFTTPAVAGTLYDWDASAHSLNTINCTYQSVYGWISNDTVLVGKAGSAGTTLYKTTLSSSASLQQLTEIIDIQKVVISKEKKMIGILGKAENETEAGPFFYTVHFDGSNFQKVFAFSDHKNFISNDDEQYISWIP